MNYSAWRWPAVTLAVGLFASLSSGCIATGGGGYGYDGDVGVGVGYYEPAVVEYGGWGGGYRVAPFRRGDRRAGSGNGRTHAYRSAPASRSAPSIPSRSSARNSHPTRSR
jgi:hypothetical protein